ncbi:MAG: hypothetical protein JW909_04110 [Planctomycetes bacterium]|nr:hypothetical protein [Planctomycetota bacterium]
MKLGSGFPLLLKDLAELANRRRTYVFRIIYALLVFAAFLVYYVPEVLNASLSPAILAGKGRNVAIVIFSVQLAAVFLFTPAIVSDAVTSEKEKLTLGLLFLTGLRPWEILLQKYFGRLVPIFSCLLLSLPLLALAYSLGGIARPVLLKGVAMLVLGCLFAGALALMASSFLMTSVQAFIWSYALLLAFALGLAAAVFLSDNLSGRPVDYVTPALWAAGGITVLSLAAARLAIVRRAFLRPANVLLRLFRRLDSLFSRLNNRFGGIVLLRDRSPMPEDAPVAWREVTRKSFGNFRYLFRLLVAIEVPVAFVVVFAIMADFHNSYLFLSGAILLLWAFAFLAVAVMSVGLFTSERSARTLEVLLSTPLPVADIVRQKTLAVRRVILVLAVPFVTVLAAQTHLRSCFFLFNASSSGIFSGWSAFPRFLFAVCAVFVYLYAVMWLSVWTGLRSASPARAVISVIVGVMVWNLLPFVAGVLALCLPGDPADAVIFSLLLSPAALVWMTGVAPPLENLNLPLVFGLSFNILLHVAAAFLFRFLCLKKADAYLRKP